MTILPLERREAAKIVTESGEEWFLQDIRGVFDKDAKAGT